MAWTYSGDPASTSKDAVRFLTGDVNIDEPLKSDEEINWALSQNSNIYAASLTIAESILSYLSLQADVEEIGPIKSVYSKRVENYSNRVKDLRVKVSSNASMIPYGGGIDATDKVTQAEDTSIVKPNFWIGMDDYPNSEDTRQ